MRQQNRMNGRLTIPLFQALWIGKLKKFASSIVKEMAWTSVEQMSDARVVHSTIVAVVFVVVFCGSIWTIMHNVAETVPCLPGPVGVVPFEIVNGFIIYIQQTGEGKELLLHDGVSNKVNIIILGQGFQQDFEALQLIKTDMLPWHCKVCKASLGNFMYHPNHKHLWQAWNWWNHSHCKSFMGRHWGCPELVVSPQLLGSMSLLQLSYLQSQSYLLTRKAPVRRRLLGCPPD